MVGGRHPPPRNRGTTSSSSWPSSSSTVSPPSVERSCRRRSTYLPFFFFVAFFFAIRITSFRVRSVAHRFAPQMLGLLASAALVVHEIGVELRETHDLEAALLERAVEHAEVVGRQEMQRAVRLRGGAQAEGPRDRRRVALEIAVHGREPQARREQRGAGVQGEGVPAILGAGYPRDLTHELPRDALGRQVRGVLVHPIGVGLAPPLEQIGRLREPEALAVVALDPRELLEALDDVVRVAQAHLGGAPELLEPPRSARLDEQYPDHAGRARSEERAERPRRGPNVALALFLDQRVFQGQVAVAGQIDESEVVALEDTGALRADVHGAGHGVGAGKLPANLVQPGHGSPDLARLTERRDLNDHRVLLAGEVESGQ